MGKRERTTETEVQHLKVRLKALEMTKEEANRLAANVERAANKAKPQHSSETSPNQRKKASTAKIGRPVLDGNAINELRKQKNAKKQGISKQIISMMKCEDCGLIEWSIRFKVLENKVQCPNPDCNSFKISTIE